MNFTFWHPLGRLLWLLHDRRAAPTPSIKPAPVTYPEPVAFRVAATLADRVDRFRNFFRVGLHELGDYHLVLHLDREPLVPTIRLDLGTPTIILCDAPEMVAHIKARPFEPREQVRVLGISLIDGAGNVVGGGPKGIARWQNGPQILNPGDTLHAEYTLSAKEEFR